MCVWFYPLFDDAERKFCYGDTSRDCRSVWKSPRSWAFDRMAACERLRMFEATVSESCVSLFCHHWVSSRELLSTRTVFVNNRTEMVTSEKHYTTQKCTLWHSKRMCRYAQRKIHTKSGRGLFCLTREITGVLTEIAVSSRVDFPFH